MKYDFLRSFYGLSTLFLLITICPAFAQQANISSSNTMPADELLIEEVMDLQNQYVKTGIMYERPAPIIQGVPFLRSADWHNGNISINHNLYYNLDLNYDVFQQELLLGTLQKNGAKVGVKVETEKVDYFTLGDSLFINLREEDSRWPDLKPGFYQLLDYGNNQAFVHYTKVIRTDYSGERAREFFDIEHSYFLCKESVCKKLTRNRDLMKLYPKNKREIKRLLKLNGFKPGRDISSPAIMLVLQALEDHEI